MKNFPKLSIYISCIVNILPMYVLSIGFVLFLLSDLVLSMQYFGDKLHDKKLIIINHSLYYLAQIIIAMFLFLVGCVFWKRFAEKAGVGKRGVRERLKQVVFCLLWFLFFFLFAFFILLNCSLHILHCL